jgi:hypothetical protein
MLDFRQLSARLQPLVLGDQRSWEDSGRTRQGVFREDEPTLGSLLGLEDAGEIEAVAERAA